MNSSARASSSAVVTPGRMCSPISASVSATTRPARAICSISWVDLRMIMVAPFPESCRLPAKRRSRKNAGSARSRRLRVRLRTQRDRALQRSSGCEAGKGSTGSSSHRHLLERLADLREYLLDRPLGVDSDHVRLLRPVVLDERRRLLLVDPEAALDRLRSVVGAVLLHGPLQQPREQRLAVGDLEVEDDVEVAGE